MRRHPLAAAAVDLDAQRQPRREPRTELARRAASAGGLLLLAVVIGGGSWLLLRAGVEPQTITVLGILLPLFIAARSASPRRSSYVKTEIMKIICIGRNYRDHIADFDGGPLPGPLFFLKPDTALLRNNDPFYIPDFTQEVHYECELVVRIDRLARHIAPRFRPTSLRRSRTGHRLHGARPPTRGDRQRMAVGACQRIRLLGRRGAAVRPRRRAGRHPAAALHARNQRRGTATKRYTGDMIFGVDELLSHVSRYITTARATCFSPARRPA